MASSNPVYAAEYICSCFYTKQIFVSKYGIHVTFESESQFHKDYRQILRFKGCSSDKQYAEVLSKVNEEIERRRSYHSTFLENYLRNQKIYKYIYPELKHLKVNQLDPRFLAIAEEKNLTNYAAFLESIKANGGQVMGTEVYSFPLFTPEFCEMLVEEIENFKKRTPLRSLPNTMNYDGVSMDEMGVSYTLLTDLIQQYFQGITKLLYPNWGGGFIDSFKSFTTHYENNPGKQSKLSKHFDNAEVSMSVCLTSDFEGGELELGEMHGEDNIDNEYDEPVIVQQKIGQCILHRSQQFHWAHGVTSGKRINIIIWMRSSQIRNHRCPMCWQHPTICKVPIAGDGFTPGNADLPHSSSCTTS